MKGVYEARRSAFIAFAGRFTSGHFSNRPAQFIDEWNAIRRGHASLIREAEQFAGDMNGYRGTMTRMLISAGSGSTAREVAADGRAHVVGSLAGYGVHRAPSPRQHSLFRTGVPKALARMTASGLSGGTGAVTGGNTQRLVAKGELMSPVEDLAHFGTGFVAAAPFGVFLAKAGAAKGPPPENVPAGTPPRVTRRWSEGLTPDDGYLNRGVFAECPAGVPPPPQGYKFHVSLTRMPNGSFSQADAELIANTLLPFLRANRVNHNRRERSGGSSTSFSPVSARGSRASPSPSRGKGPWAAADSSLRATARSEGITSRIPRGKWSAISSVDSAPHGPSRLRFPG